MSDLTPDAVAPMPPPLRLSSLPDSIRSGSPDPRTGVPKRGPGRPPGSRNKTKEPPGGVNPPQRFGTPGTTRNPITPPPKTDTTDEAAKKRQEKKERADEYSQLIRENLNDKLFMLIVGATSIPAEALFSAGRVPPKAATNPNYTDFGNTIAIPADVADSWGKLIAELSYTDVGKTLVKAGEKDWLVLLIAFASAVFSTYRYSQQVKPITDMIKAQNEAKRKAKEGTDANSSSTEQEG